MFIASAIMKIKNAVGVTCLQNEALINMRHSHPWRRLNRIVLHISINMSTLRVWNRVSNDGK